MAKKRYTAEHIIGHLRQVEVMVSQGRKMEDALREIERFFKQSHKVIVALTVKEILDEQIARKLV